MENTNIINQVLDKKINDYGTNMNDFTAPQELTVTITLSEYRQLVKDVATRKSAIDEANKDKYERDNENKNLKEEISKLKAELYELKKAAEKNDCESEEV